MGSRRFSRGVFLEMPSVTIEIVVYNNFMTKVIKIIQPSADYSLIKPYIDNWVALTRDRKKVIAANKDFKKLSEKLDKMGIAKDQAVLQYVLDPKATYSF